MIMLNKSQLDTQIHKGHTGYTINIKCSQWTEIFKTEVKYTKGESGVGARALMNVNIHKVRVLIVQFVSVLLLKNSKVLQYVGNITITWLNKVREDKEIHYISQSVYRHGHFDQHDINKWSMLMITKLEDYTVILVSVCHNPLSQSVRILCVG